MTEERNPPLRYTSSKLPFFSTLGVHDGLEKSGDKTENSSPAKEQTNSLSAEETESSKSKEERLSLQYESFSKMHSHDVAFQDKHITWNSLGCLLLKHVGGVATVDLLMEHLHDPLVAKNCLSPEFLKGCYVDFIIKMQQK